MNCGNIITLLFLVICLFSVFAFFFLNIKTVFKSKKNAVFVILNQTVFLFGVALYCILYYFPIFWVWKIVFSILVLNMILGGMMFVRTYVSEHFYDKLEIENGTLKKVYASEYLRILKLPNDCVRLDANVLNNFKELEEIYFGKNFENLSEDIFKEHYMVHTLHFTNPNTRYCEEIQNTYKIKQKH